MKKIVIICLSIILYSCGGNYAVKVNNTAIYYNHLEFEAKKVFNSNLKLNKSEKRKFVVQLIDKMAFIEISAVRAEERGIKVTENEINVKIESLKNPEGNNSGSIKSVWGWPDEEKTYRSELRKNILMEKLLEKVITAGIHIPDSDIAEYYTNYSSEFHQEESAHVYQIYFPGSSSESLKKAKEIRASIETIEQFLEKAKELSENYDLPFYSRGDMNEKFDKVIFSIKENTISTPFVSNFGVHIVLVTERTEEGIITFENAAVNIKQKLIDEEYYKQRMIYEYNIKKEIKILYDKDLFEKLGL